MKEKVADKFVWKVSLKREIVLFLVLLAITVFLRFWHLGADSPHKISFSLGIETDPPQYTLFARNAVKTGDWNPYQDQRYITYLYSLVSGAGWLIYKLFGVGTFQTNVVASILSLLTIIMFYFIVRRALGNGTALLTMLFIGVNYLGIFFGRRPFLENGMNLLFVLSLFCLVFIEKKILGHFLFGLFFAASVFFGKIIASGFIGVPLVYYIYRLIFLKQTEVYARAGAAAVGFMAVFVFWFMVIFTPYHEQVTGYVGEQALGLYGMPEAMESFGKFVWKFLSLGKGSEFFDRMPALTIGSLFLLVLLSNRIFAGSGSAGSSRYCNTRLILIVMWLVSTYLAQMPWNYQPARYQTAMIFPMAAMTAAFIAYLHNQRDRINILNRSVVSNLLIFIGVLWLIYRYLGKIISGLGYEYYFKDYIFYAMLMAGVMAGTYAFISWKTKIIETTLSPFVRYGGIALIIVVFVVYQGRAILAWSDNILYTTSHCSKDLGMILSPGAVISGPYGPALAQENDLGCVIHIFGTSRPDPDLFKKYPITHLITERANEEVARELYPDLMEKAKPVTHYYVNCRKLTVYRIAFITGNPEAFDYLPSSYEKAVMFYSLNMPDSADYYLNRFQQLYPNNISGNILVAYYAQHFGEYDKAIELFQDAVDFSPTDFNLHYLLGQAYRAKADKTGDTLLMDLARKEGALATKLDLGYHDFDEYIFKPLEEDNIGPDVPQN